MNQKMRLNNTANILGRQSQKMFHDEERKVK